MTKEEKEVITDLTKCNFNQIHEYYKRKSEERKAMSKEEKKVKKPPPVLSSLRSMLARFHWLLERCLLQAIKEGKDKLAAEYGFCVMDGHKEKIANFNIEPPGLFRGRGNHPKMGMHKRRVMPEDVIINCSKCVHLLKKLTQNVNGYRLVHALFLESTKRNNISYKLPTQIRAFQKTHKVAQG